MSMSSQQQCASASHTTCRFYTFAFRLGTCSNALIWLHCRHEDPAAWIKHQKRRWQAGVQERKRRKLEAAKAAGRPPDPSRAPKGKSTRPLSAIVCPCCSAEHSSPSSNCFRQAEDLALWGVILTLLVCLLSDALWILKARFKQHACILLELPLLS